jgi:transposase-like protein
MVKRPLAVVHDGLHTYNEAFNREFYTNYGPRIENVRSEVQRDEGLNQMIERVNNTVRDREKTFRGMDSDDSAQTMANGIRINYNFIRPHMGLDGKTPAQAAELDLGLDGTRTMDSKAFNGAQGRKVRHGPEDEDREGNT